MNHIVYILWSESLQQYYCGQTNDFTDRLYRHNSGQSQSTSRGIPWILIRKIETVDRKEAMQLEKKIKKRGIGRYLNDLQHGR
jgi:putative endonuclease